MNPRIDALEKLLNGPRDGALLRFSLGNAYLAEGNAGAAAMHLQEAVARDPHYSAAWKALGKALTEAGRPVDALAAYERGMAVAQARGDIQAEKEMSVFARRIRKTLPP